MSPSSRVSGQAGSPCAGPGRLSGTVSGKEDVENDALFRLCRQLRHEELTRREMGLLLKQALLKSKVRIGQLALLLQHTHVATECVSSAPRDVLPLPVRKPDLDEHCILAALAGGATPAHVRKDFGRALPRAGRAAWIFLLILVVNFLHLGWSRAQTLEGTFPQDLTQAQLSSLAFFEGQVDYFLRDDHEVNPIDWAQLLQSTSVSYNQELVLKGRPLTWRWNRGSRHRASLGRSAPWTLPHPSWGAC